MMNNNSNWAFIQRGFDYDFIGEVRESELIKFEVYNANEKSIVGNIYRGRLVNKIPGLKAFFVDIGMEKNGFLQLKSSEFNYYNEGDELIVQVISKGDKNKGPKLTISYEIKSELVILTPFNKTIRFSKKIKDLEFENKLINLLEKYKSCNTGFIIRTKAYDFSLEEINKTILKLLNVKNKLEAEKNFSPTPKLLHEEKLNQLYEFSQRIKIFTNYQYHNKILIELGYDSIYDSDFKVSNTIIFNDIKEIFSRKVTLENGIELVFDETEAFNVIDINSKGFIRKDKNLEMDDVNLNSVKYIIKHIHFRNIYGIILIDFISLKDKNKELEIIRLIKEYSKNYSNPVNVIGFTKLGILELTRNKKVNNLSTKKINLNYLR